MRSQLASVRAILAEIERLVPTGDSIDLREQFIEELARLGCRCLETASAMADEARPPARRSVGH